MNNPEAHTGSKCDELRRKRNEAVDNHQPDNQNLSPIAQLNDFLSDQLGIICQSQFHATQYDNQGKSRRLQSAMQVQTNAIHELRCQNILDLILVRRLCSFAACFVQFASFAPYLPNHLPVNGKTPTNALFLCA